MVFAVQDITDGRAVLGGELEVGMTVRVAVDALQGMLGVDPDPRMFDQVFPNLVGTPELLGSVADVHDSDAEPGHGTTRQRSEVVSQHDYHRSGGLGEV